MTVVCGLIFSAVSIGSSDKDDAASVIKKCIVEMCEVIKLSLYSSNEAY